jgi:hypothetical protein
MLEDDYRFARQRNDATTPVHVRVLSAHCNQPLCEHGLIDRVTGRSQPSSH